MYYALIKILLFGVYFFFGGNEFDINLLFTFCTGRGNCCNEFVQHITAHTQFILHSHYAATLWTEQLNIQHDATCMRFAWMPFSQWHTMYVRSLHIPHQYLNWVEDEERNEMNEQHSIRERHFPSWRIRGIFHYYFLFSGLRSKKVGETKNNKCHVDALKIINS